jgi:putative copper resistance protein D
MLGFAAANRLRWAPRLRTASRNSAPLALRRLGRNALAETFLGLAVLGIVGALGVSVPAKHVQTVWPFPYTVDPSKPWWLAPAHPTTYLRSPVPYTAASIARGAPLYREHCTACHGAYGYGDGPAAAALAVRPPNLTEHLSHHREGDLFWWLQHGIAGTPMPGFGDRIGDDRLWDLINFLRAQADAARAKEMDSGVGEWRPIAAPDFDFQIGARPQESLRESLSQGLVLLVFCAPPAADGRLRALQTAQAELRRAGVRVLAMEVGRAPAPVGARAEDPTIADPDPRVAAAYALFSGTASREPGAVDDIEFLIDREGYLRARWSPGDQPDWSRLPELLQQVETLNREPPHARASEAHVH